MLAASRKRSEFCIVGETAVLRLAQATGMHRRGGDRQSHRGEHTHQQQNQQ